jgi:TonB-dependent receptor
MLRTNRYCFGFLAIFLLLGLFAHGQERKGTISGRVTDVNHDALVGARVEVQPNGYAVTTDVQGAFTISDLAPGKYTLTVSYVGFKPFSKEVTVAAGVTNGDAMLDIETVNEQVIVPGERERGEVEAINREMNADNIVQVLPAEVITSLPNTNIADAVGRLPSVSLERDEGEGKYVQVRGTEPRLTNLTLDGVHVPSPESVRQVKLDAIPADLVDSVEINKTLSPSQEGDAIGGSVNLVTKRAGERPFMSLQTMGGYTPVGLGGRLNEVDGTIGKRFGREKRLGLLVGGSYDYNQRGTDDIEPSPGVNTINAGGPNTPPTGSFSGQNGMDVRQYAFYRHRYGFVGSADYKLGQGSLIYLRGLFSHFLDYGEDWIYTPSVGTFTSPTTTANDSTMNYTQVIRRPQQRIFNVIAGANHSLGKTLITYEGALGQGRSRGGFYSANFSGPAPVTDANGNVIVPGPQFRLDESDPFVPKFIQVNATPSTNILDPANYVLGGPNFHFFKTISMATDNHILERDITGSASVTRQYALGSHFGAWEIGFKARDAHKSQSFFEPTFTTTNQGASLAPLTQFAASTKNPNPGYYFGNYPLLPLSNFNKLLSYFNANRSLFTEATDFEHLISDSNDYHSIERVIAGYVQNTITFGHFKVVGGLRIEGTQGSFVGTQATFGCPANPPPTCVPTDPVTGDSKFQGDTPVPGQQTYTNFLPSVQVQYNINGSTNIRAAYGRGIARPNFSDLPPFQSVENGRNRVTVGNPALKPTHANDYDLLFEHYLKSVGIVEAGWFYKDLSDPIFQIQTTLPATDKNFPNFQQRQPINGRKAHITGIEFAWQQHFTFLPGLLNGTGLSANYSYTTSQAKFPIDPNTGSPTRADSPSLLRQAPNNWNFDATYDKGPISARMGLTHNDRSIFFYNFQDGAAGGIKGPNGDVYYYPHTQVDAQVSYRIPRGHGIHFIVSMLNLNNEVFGFYQGSEQFPIQREYYSATISGGLRWTSNSEVK